MTVVGSIVVVGALTYALFHSMSDLKATQKMNPQCSLIKELMFEEFESGYIAAETAKNICCVKGEGIVDYITVTR